MFHISDSCKCTHYQLFGDVTSLHDQVGNAVDYYIVVGDYVRVFNSDRNPFKPCDIVK